MSDKPSADWNASVLVKEKKGLNPFKLIKIMEKQTTMKSIQL